MPSLHGASVEGVRVVNPGRRHHMAARSWLVLLAVPLWLSFAGLAWAQQDQRQYVVVYVEFQPTQIHHGKDLLEDLQARALRSRGSINFTVLDEIDRANRFDLVELWTNAQAYQDFKNAARTQAIIDRIEPILAAPMDERPGNLIR
jgi:quinol monooxygenase YgiN